MYTKRFKTFMQGIDELCNISYSIEDSLSASHYEPVRTLNREAIEWGLNKNIINGERYHSQNCPHGQIYDNYVSYTTTSDVEYGWKEEDNNFRFYIEFREGSIYENAKNLSWTWEDHFFAPKASTQNRIKEYQKKLEREEKFNILKRVYDQGLKLDSLKTYKESYRIINQKESYYLLDLENMEFPCFVEVKTIFGDTITDALYLIYKPLKTNSLQNKYIGFDQGIMISCQTTSDDPYYQEDPKGFKSQEEFIQEFKKYKDFFNFMDKKKQKIKEEIKEELKKQAPLNVLVNTPISKLTDLQIDIIHNTTISNFDIAIVNNKVTLFDGETFTKEAKPEDTLSSLFSEILFPEIK